jgi:hypothetical protein
MDDIEKNIPVGDLEIHDIPNPQTDERQDDPPPSHPFDRLLTGPRKIRNSIFPEIRNYLTSPENRGPDSGNEPTLNRSLRLAAAIVATKDAKGHDEHSRYTAIALRRFTWMNRLNLVLYQTELVQLENELQDDVPSLFDSTKIEKMRKLLEEYSIDPSSL